MHSNDSETPWLECDEWQGDDGLLGNRRGFELLREAIDRVLEEGKDPVILGVERSSMKVLKLSTPPPLPGPPNLRDKVVGVLVFAFLFSIPLLALFGLCQLIDILSS